MAMRAVSTDIDAARLQAIDVNRIISFTFGAGSLLAAVGGILWSYKYPQLNPLMGVMPGLKCFIAAVIGGIGNIQGAVLGGFLLGLIELLTIAFLPTLTGYRDAFAFVLLIARPAGEALRPPRRPPGREGVSAMHRSAPTSTRPSPRSRSRRSWSVADTWFDAFRSASSTCARSTSCSRSR